jgi:DNA-directed RNA polymerase specialized sigma24 family protein
MYSFEDKLKEIEAALERKRPKWQLDAVPYIDYDDIKQVIMTHIYKKWHLWDQSKPVEPWLSRVVANQFKNLLRNHYGNYANPCPNQHLVDHDPLTCPICKKWNQSKRSAYNIKLAVTMENHLYEIEEKKDNFLDIDSAAKKLSKAIKPHLSSRHFKAFSMLFIENRTEEEVAKFLGFKTNEKKRSAGYKQIKNLKKIFQEKAKEIIKNNDII